MDLKERFMDIKDSIFNSELVTYGVVVATTIWGGLNSFFSKVEQFSWRKLLVHLTSSSFAGMMTFLLCQEAGISGPLTGVFCGVAAHMGTPALIALLMKSKMIKTFFETGQQAKAE